MMATGKFQTEANNTYNPIYSSYTGQFHIPQACPVYVKHKKAICKPYLPLHVHAVQSCRKQIGKKMKFIYLSRCKNAKHLSENLQMYIII